MSAGFSLEQQEEKRFLMLRWGKLPGKQVVEVEGGEGRFVGTKEFHFVHLKFGVVKLSRRQLDR